MLANLGRPGQTTLITVADDVVSLSSFSGGPSDRLYALLVESISAGVAEVKKGSAFSPNFMTSNNTPPPYVVTATEEFWFEGTGDYYRAFRAFDGIESSYGWETYNDTNASITLDLGIGNAKRMHTYSIKVAPYLVAYAPKSWILYGSNNESSWTKLDEVSEFTAWSQNNFIIERAIDESFWNVAYRYYKLHVLDVVSGGYIHIREIVYYEPAETKAGEVIIAFGSDPVVGDATSGTVIDSDMGMFWLTGESLVSDVRCANLYQDSVSKLSVTPFFI